MGNYVIAGVGNYVIENPSNLGNYVIADSCRYRPAPGHQRVAKYGCRSARGSPFAIEAKRLRSRPPPQCPANGRLTYKWGNLAYACRSGGVPPHSRPRAPARTAPRGRG